MTKPARRRGRVSFSCRAAREVRADDRADLRKRVDEGGGGGGSRTRVFRDCQWGFSERIRELISGRRHSSAADGDPSLSEVSRRALRRVLDGKPLLMAPRFRPSGWAGRDALLVGTRQRVRGRPRRCSHLCLLPTLLRRSGDVGSLPPPRSSKSKPRTPMSSAAPVRVGERDPSRLPAADARLDGVGDGGEAVLIAVELDEAVGDDHAHQPGLGVGEADGAERS